MYKTLVPFVIVLVITLSASNAKADTVDLQGGMIFSGFSGNFDTFFSGYNSEGVAFSTSARGSTSSGIHISRPSNAPGGTQVNLGGSAFLVGGDFSFGSFVINGITYSPNLLDLHFASSSFATVPVSSESFVTVQGSCGPLTGAMRGQTDPPVIFSPVVSFSGGCGATMYLTKTGTDAQGHGLYSFSSLSYSFSARPTPEPLAVLLLATGLSGLAATLRARRTPKR